MDHTEQKCNGCGYDLRAKSLESEFCPECGAYLSFLEPDEKSFSPPLVLYQTLSKDDGRILVRNVTLPPGVVESFLQKASHRTEAWVILGLGGTIFSFFAMCYLIFAFPTPLRDLAQDSVFLTIVGLIVGHIALYKFFVKSVVIRRSMTRHVRKAMRRAGHDICFTCGWLYSPDQADLDACPHCERPHRKS